MTLYNEFDAYPAQWLRSLIGAGHLPDGVVDERSIKDLQPEDCHETSHFFAGIGGWPLALRLAGWEGPVWTGSCPCQPFSVAGKRGGTDDPRHLWPEWFRLIKECRPQHIFGEQVGSKDGLAWLDIVQSDLEDCGYTVGAVVVPACGFGAPHIRQRLYFVAHRLLSGLEGHAGDGDGGREPGWLEADAARPTAARGADGGLEDASRLGRRGRGDGDSSGDGGPLQTAGPGPIGGVGDAVSAGRQPIPNERRGDAEGERSTKQGEQPGLESMGTGAANGFWSDAIWLPCSDGKARATQPGLFPLAHGVPNRVGRLRAYGNALVIPQAVEFVRAYLEVVSTD